MKNKRGQLFLIEVFISVTIMLIMTIAIYRLELTSRSETTADPLEDVKRVLFELEESGLLQSCASDENITVVGRTIEEILGPSFHVRINLNVLIDSDWETLTIFNEGKSPSIGTNVDTISFITHGLASDNRIYEYFIQFWTMGA